MLVRRALQINQRAEPSQCFWPKPTETATETVTETETVVETEIETESS